MTLIDPNRPPRQQPASRWGLRNRRMVLGPPADHPLWKSHAQAPTVLPVAPNLWIALFAGRDAHNRSRVYAAELTAADLSVRTVYPGPVLDLGAPDAFDAHGVGAGTAVLIGDRIRLYYSGGRVQADGSVLSGIGIAESADGGRSFARLRDAPFLGMDANDPLGAAMPTVMREGEGWVMWYSSFKEWRQVDGKPEPIYDIRRAQSRDGIDWTPDAAPALPFADADEGGLIRMQVMATSAGPLAIASARAWRAFRAGQGGGYRLVCARSADGLTWTRDPGALQIADEPGVDWDNDMRCYPWLVEDGGRRLLFYNGNDFGRHGFGVGELHPVEEAP